MEELKEMLNKEKKIKEIYDCKYIISDEGLYPLQKWYNELIDKSINEINIADVLRMLRQKVFTKLAMLKAIEFLRKNIFVGELYDGELYDGELYDGELYDGELYDGELYDGELYDGELLQKISELDTIFLASYASDLKSILKDYIEKCKLHTWAYEGEEEEFKDIVKSILVKLTY